MSATLTKADWPAPSNIVAGSTTRAGGVSSGVFASLNLAAHVGDCDKHVSENRRKLVEAGELPAEPKWLNQVHGKRIIDASDALFDSGPPAADAVVSQRGNEVVAILTADCLPLLLCSTRGDEVAAVHCGWRGLVAGIVADTVNVMSNEPEHLLAWFGPAISQAAFEVGDEVRDLFLAGVECATACFQANDSGRWQADLYGLARRYLATAGVVQVYGGGLCTYADSERFFSHRRDGQCGRMASYIYLQS